MSTMFVDEQARQTIAAWFHRFHARLPSPTESRTVPTRFGDTHVLVGGPVDGPPLVLLHGAMASSAHVLVELAPLLERFRVYAVDIVGQSVKSAEARPRVDNNDYGEWLVDTLDALGLARAHVVGISWGGFVAIRLAALAPERIERLVLLAPAGMVTGPAWAGFTKIGLPMMLYRRWPSPRRLQAFVKNLLTTTDDDWVPYLGDAFLAYRLNMSIPARARPEELRALRAPTLVLGADGDISFPGAGLVARARVLFPSLAAAELIEGCRHSPPTTEPFRRWLSTRITTFLSPS